MRFYEKKILENFLHREEIRRRGRGRGGHSRSWAQVRRDIVRSLNHRSNNISPYFGPGSTVDHYGTLSAPVPAIQHHRCPAARTTQIGCCDSCTIGSTINNDPNNVSMLYRKECNTCFGACSMTPTIHSGGNNLNLSRNANENVGYTVHYPQNNVPPIIHNDYPNTYNGGNINQSVPNYSTCNNNVGGNVDPTVQHVNNCVGELVRLYRTNDGQIIVKGLTGNVTTTMVGRNVTQNRENNISSSVHQPLTENLADVNGRQNPIQHPENKDLSSVQQDLTDLIDENKIRQVIIKNRESKDNQLIQNNCSGCCKNMEKTSSNKEIPGEVIKPHPEQIQIQLTSNKSNDGSLVKDKNSTKDDFEVEYYDEFDGTRKFKKKTKK